MVFRVFRTSGKETPDWMSMWSNGGAKWRVVVKLRTTNVRLNVCFLLKHNIGDSIVHLDGFIKSLYR